MKITKHKSKGDILIEFKKFIVWFYPHRHMNISHMKPKTLIKGFLYKSEYYGTSYMMDFYNSFPCHKYTKIFGNLQNNY